MKNKIIAILSAALLCFGGMCGITAHANYDSTAAAPAATLLASALPWKASLSLAAFSAFLAASSSSEISASSAHFWAS